MLSESGVDWTITGMLIDLWIVLEMVRSQSNPNHVQSTICQAFSYHCEVKENCNYKIRQNCHTKYQLLSGVQIPGLKHNDGHINY